MADIQSTFGGIKLIIDGITILLMIIAASMAIKKKNNICLGVVIVGNLLAYYYTQSPFICMIISIGCMIWAARTNRNETTKEVINKQPLKSSNANIDEGKKMTKPGPIIGLIIGILMAGFPIVGFMIGEGSLSDPQGKMIGYGFMIFGAFMVIVNIIVLVTGKENLLSSDKESNVSHVQAKPKQVVEISEESNGDMVRCRFCKKLYSSDYNGCPHCKKK